MESETTQVKAKPRRKDLVEALENDPQRMRWLKDSLKCFTHLRKNHYLQRKRKQPRNDQLQRCPCRPQPQIGSENFNSLSNCREKCLNRMICTQCDDQTCNCGSLCQNRKFQNHQYSIVYPKPYPGKGWGLCAGELIKKGSFIMQYIGQVFSIKGEQGRKRCKLYSSSTCTYLMKTSKGEVIDPTDKGNLARFINHSCEPNSITQKWNVLGQICIGIFALRDILQNQQITFDYQFDAFNTPLTKCLCGAGRCKGYLGLRPTNITPEQWEERLEGMTCQLCVKNYQDDDVTLMICDSCNNGFHLYCLTPPLKQIPKDAFFCDQCKQIVNKQKQEEQLKKLQLLETKKVGQFYNKKKPVDEDPFTEPEHPKNFNEFIDKIQMRALHQCYFDSKPKQPTIFQRVQRETDQNQRSGSKANRNQQILDHNKHASIQFQKRLKQNGQMLNELNKFSDFSQNNSGKRSVMMSKIGMHLFRSNYALFQKVQAKIFWDHSARNMQDFFFKHVEVTALGNPAQLSMFVRLIDLINNCVKQVQLRSGITEAQIQIPAIFLKKLNGPGNVNLSKIERSHKVTVFYNKKFINDQCYPLETKAKLLIKGGKQNILQAFQDIKQRLSNFQTQRIFVNPYQLKLCIQNINLLKRRRDLAQFRISREPPFKQVNHPFFYMQERLKEITIVGTHKQISFTRKQLMTMMEQSRLKQDFVNSSSVYLAPFQLKSIFSSLKIPIQKEGQGTKTLIFDPIPPRKNMTVSLLGTRSQRAKGKQALLKRLQNYIKQNQYSFNFDLFQDQMNFQMTKYLFKYMQNAFLTRDPAFMKNWDIYTPYFSDDSYLFKSVKKQLLYDSQTLLYACYSLPASSMKHLLKQSSIVKGPEHLFPKLQVLQLIRQNMNRLLNYSNVQTTSGLKNYKSVMNDSRIRKLYKLNYSYLNWDTEKQVDREKEIRQRQKRQRSNSRDKKKTSVIDDEERTMSNYERLLVRKRKGLRALMEYDQSN